MYRSISLLIIFPGFLTAVPAPAQLYKWIDKDGITNFSNQAPTDRKPAMKLELVMEKFSYAAPERVISPVPSAALQNNQQELSRKIDKLERELQAERQARQYAAYAIASPPAYEQPYNADDTSYYPAYNQYREANSNDYYSYGAPIVFVPLRYRPIHSFRAPPVSRLTVGSPAWNVNDLRNVNRNSTAFRTFSSAPMRQRLR